VSQLTRMDDPDDLLGEAGAHADLRIGRQDGTEPLSIRDEVARCELDHVDEPPGRRRAVLLLLDLVLEAFSPDLQLSKLALDPELFALQAEQLGGQRLAPHRLLAPEPDDRQALDLASVVERVDIREALELLELGDGAGRAVLGELRALLGQPVPGRELALLLSFLADCHFVDQVARSELCLLVGDLVTDDGELLVQAARCGLVLLELEALAARVELDEQIAFLDVFVEVEQRAHHAARGCWFESVHRVVRLDPALRADLHHRHPGADGPGD